MGTPRAMKELMQLEQLQAELSAFSSSNSSSSGRSSGSWSSGSSCGKSVAQLDCDELSDFLLYGDHSDQTPSELLLTRAAVLSLGSRRTEERCESAADEMPCICISTPGT